MTYIRDQETSIFNTSLSPSIFSLFLVTTKKSTLELWLDFRFLRAFSSVLYNHSQVSHNDWYYSYLYIISSFYNSLIRSRYLSNLFSFSFFINLTGTTKSTIRHFFVMDCLFIYFVFFFFLYNQILSSDLGWIIWIFESKRNLCFKFMNISLVCRFKP